jgi:hypothetical protein
MIGGALAVIYLIWAGIQYIQAGGDASKAKAARTSIINAIIGVVVILSAYTIIRFASSIANCVAHPERCTISAQGSTSSYSGSTTDDSGNSGDNTDGSNNSDNTTDESNGTCQVGSTDPACNDYIGP